jgi:hypothetical protein
MLTYIRPHAVAIDRAQQQSGSMDELGPLAHSLQGDALSNSTQLGVVIKDVGLPLISNMPGKWQRTVDNNGDLLLGCITDEAVSSIDITLGKVRLPTSVQLLNMRLCIFLG